MAQPDSNEERTESDDNSQFKVVNHPPKSLVDKLCGNIRNGDLTTLKNIDFNKLTKDEHKKVEGSVYYMMVENSRVRWPIAKRTVQDYRG